MKTLRPNFQEAYMIALSSIKSSCGLLLLPNAFRVTNIEALAAKTIATTSRAFFRQSITAGVDCSMNLLIFGAWPLHAHCCTLHKGI